MQGKLIGDYLVENFDKVDLNGDGKISYAMFMGQLGNVRQSIVPSTVWKMPM
ncbi:MAG: hypothetical protein V8S98_06175 [Lachnospiraceae bacterium]